MGTLRTPQFVDLYSWHVRLPFGLGAIRPVGVAWQGD